MLGWQVFVYMCGEARPENLVAHWTRGSVALDWIEKLVQNGYGRDQGGTGYPWILRVEAGAFIAAVTVGGADTSKVFSRNIVVTVPPGLTNFMTLNEKLIRRCGAEKELIVYAYDQS